MLFYPHKFDGSTGGKGWECDLASITSVGVSERGRNPFDGSMRRRLKIECDDATDYFVVNKAEAIAAAIRTAAGPLSRPDLPIWSLDTGHQLGKCAAWSGTVRSLAGAVG